MAGTKFTNCLLEPNIILVSLMIAHILNVSWGIFFLYITLDIIETTTFWCYPPNLLTQVGPALMGFNWKMQMDFDTF